MCGNKEQLVVDYFFRSNDLIVLLGCLSCFSGLFQMRFSFAVFLGKKIMTLTIANVLKLMGD